jgi:hypothetical protein
VTDSYTPSVHLSVVVAGTQHARNDPLAGHHPKVHMPGGIFRSASRHEGAAAPVCQVRQRRAVRRAVAHVSCSATPAGGDQPAITMS